MRRSVEEPENEMDDFQDAFRRNLHGYRAPVDPQGWSRLEEILNANSENKRRGFITWLAAACAGLVLVAGTVIGYLNLQKNNSEIALKTVPNVAEKVSIPVQKETENTIASADVVAEKTTRPGNLQKEKNQKPEAKNRSTEAKTATIKSENTAVAVLSVEQNTIQTAFENEKAKQSNTKFNSIALNTTKNGIAAAEKVSEQLSAKIASDEINAAEPNAGYSATTLAKVASEKNVETGLGQNETIVVIARHSPKNATISRVKSQAATENPAGVSSEINAKQTATTEAGSIVFNASGNAKFTKSNSPEKSQQEIFSPNPDSSVTAKTLNSAEGTKTITFSPAATSSQMLASDKAITSDSAQILLAKAEIVTPENSKEAKEENTAGRLSKWSVALAYSALKFEQQLSIGSNSSNSNPNNPTISATPTNFKAVQEFNEKTRGLYSSETQLLAGYQLTPALTLQSGIKVSSYATETQTNYKIRRQANTIGSGQLVTEYDEMPVLVAVLNDQFQPDSVEEVKQESENIKYTYRYIGVPLALQGQLQLKDRLYAYAKAGVTLSKLVQSRILTNGKEGEATLTNAQDSYREWQLILNGAAGLSFKASQKLSLNAGAEVNYFTQGLIQEKEYLISSNPYSFGLNTGLTYHF